MSNYHRERFGKLTFRALALRSSEPIRSDEDNSTMHYQLAW